MAKRPIVATYYFPNWHSDPRIEALPGKGMDRMARGTACNPAFSRTPSAESSRLGLSG